MVRKGFTEGMGLKDRERGRGIYSGTMAEMQVPGTGVRLACPEALHVL